MSGVPGSDPGAAYPSWVVNTWDSQYTDVQDYQWDVAVPFWRDIDARARDAGVKVCIEMHPQNIVFNPPTLRRLVERTGATHVGAEMDPSHLFWQGIDPVAAVEWLGPLVFHAAAKDTLIHADNCAIYGVLDDRHTRVPAAENPLNLGGRSFLNKWPEDPAWEFVQWAAGTTSTSGPASWPRWPRSTRTWRSTSSTRTRPSTRSRDSGWPPRR